jgi:hypothetical protein
MNKNKSTYVRPPTGFASIKDAAAAVGVSRKVIEDAISRGELPVSTYLAPRACVSLENLAQWVERSKAQEVAR